MNTEALIQALVDQLRTVVGTAVDAAIDVTPGVDAAEVWKLSVSVPGMPPIIIAIDAVGAGALTRVMSGGGPPTDAAVRDSVKELCGNAVAAALAQVQMDVTAREIGTPERGAWTSQPDSVISRFESDALPEPLTVVVLVDVNAAAAPEAPPPTLRPVPDDSGRLDVLLDIDLPLVVRFGGTHLPLKTLSKLAPGSLIDLSRGPDDPVEMLVGERVVARGEVVMVAGCYGIRVTEVVNGREKVRGVESR